MIAPCESALAHMCTCGSWTPQLELEFLSWVWDKGNHCYRDYASMSTSMFNSAMMLVILFSLKTIESLQIEVATQFQVTPLISIGTILLASPQSSHSFDTDAWCRRAGDFLKTTSLKLLFIYADLWIETKTSSCKKMAVSLWNGLVVIFLRPLVLNSNSNGKLYL